MRRGDPHSCCGPLHALAAAVLISFLASALTTSAYAEMQHQSCDPEADATYTAAVLEYSPALGVTTENAWEHFRQNVRNFAGYAKEAKRQGAEIVVFPECGLVTLELPRLPDSSPFVALPLPPLGANPCAEAKAGSRDLDELYPQELVDLSCAARDASIYMVVNLPEEERCSPALSFCPECPGFDPRALRSGIVACNMDGKRYFNSDIAFDRKGAIVAKYRKYNLFGEEGFVPTPEPSQVTFDTDFGVRFGIFTCFDLMFEQPAVTLVMEAGVTDIIFPTAWFSELPFLTAVQAQASWAWVLDVNFLGAGYNLPEVGSTGTGLYAGRLGKVVATMGRKRANKLLVGRLPHRNACSFNGSVDASMAQLKGRIVVLPRSKDPSPPPHPGPAPPPPCVNELPRTDVKIPSLYQCHLQTLLNQDGHRNNLETDQEMEPGEESQVETEVETEAVTGALHFEIHDEHHAEEEMHHHVEAHDQITAYNEEARADAEEYLEATAPRRHDDPPIIEDEPFRQYVEDVILAGLRRLHSKTSFKKSSQEPAEHAGGQSDAEEESKHVEDEVPTLGDTIDAMMEKISDDEGSEAMKLEQAQLGDMLHVYEEEMEREELHQREVPDLNDTFKAMMSQLSGTEAESHDRKIIEEALKDVMQEESGDNVCKGNDCSEKDNKTVTGDKKGKTEDITHGHELQEKEMYSVKELAGEVQSESEDTKQPVHKEKLVENEAIILEDSVKHEACEGECEDEEEIVHKREEIFFEKHVGDEFHDGKDVKQDEGSKIANVCQGEICGEDQGLKRTSDEVKEEVHKENVEKEVPEEHVEEEVPEEHAEKEVPEEHAEKEVPEEHAEKEVPEEHAEKEVPEEHAEKEVSEEHAEKEVPEEHAEKEVPEEHAEKEVPEEHAEKEVPEEHAEKEIPEEHAEEEVPGEHVEEEVPEEDVEEEVPEEHVEDEDYEELAEEDVPEQHVEEEVHEEDFEDEIPTEHVEKEVPEEHAEEEVPEEHVKEEIPAKHVEEEVHEEHVEEVHEEHVEDEVHVGEDVPHKCMCEGEREGSDKIAQRDGKKDISEESEENAYEEHGEDEIHEGEDDEKGVSENANICQSEICGEDQGIESTSQEVKEKVHEEHVEEAEDGEGVEQKSICEGECESVDDESQEFGIEHTPQAREETEYEEHGEEKLHKGGNVDQKGPCKIECSSQDKSGREFQRVEDISERSEEDTHEKEYGKGEEVHEGESVDQSFGETIGAESAEGVPQTEDFDRCACERSTGAGENLCLCEIPPPDGDGPGGLGEPGGPGGPGGPPKEEDSMEKGHDPSRAAGTIGAVRSTLVGHDNGYLYLKTEDLSNYISVLLPAIQPNGALYENSTLRLCHERFCCHFQIVMSVDDEQTPGQNKSDESTEPAGFPGSAGSSASDDMEYPYDPDIMSLVKKKRQFPIGGKLARHFVVMEGEEEDYGDELDEEYDDDDDEDEEGVDQDEMEPTEDEYDDDEVEQLMETADLQLDSVMLKASGIGHWQGASEEASAAVQVEDMEPSEKIIRATREEDKRKEEDEMGGVMDPALAVSMPVERAMKDLPVSEDAADAETQAEEQEEHPTPTPTSKPTPSPAPMPTSMPTPTPTPTPTSMPTSMPAPTPTSMPTSMPAPTPTSMPTSTPAPTPAPTPTSMPTPASTPAPAPTSIPAATPTPPPSPVPPKEPKPKSGTVKYYYRAVVFNGQRSFDGITEGGLQVCAVIPCTGVTMESCGKLHADHADMAPSTVFRRVRVWGRFARVRALPLPSTLDTDLMPLPSDAFSLKATVRRKESDIVMELHKPLSFLTFGIYNRNFPNDAERQASIG